MYRYDTFLKTMNQNLQKSSAKLMTLLFQIFKATKQLISPYYDNPKSSVTMAHFKIEQHFQYVRQARRPLQSWKLPLKRGLLEYKPIFIICSPRFKTKMPTWQPIQPLNISLFRPFPDMQIPPVFLILKDKESINGKTKDSFSDLSTTQW